MANDEFRAAALKEIAERAPYYTPEWHYSPERPDAGTALAMIWADMYAGTLERFRRLPDNFKRALLDAIGSDARPAAAASGYLAFTARQDAGSFVIPKGTAVSASTNPDAVLVTSDDLAASPAKVSDVCRVIPSHDSVVRFSCLKNIGLSIPTSAEAHIWTFRHSFALTVSSAAVLRLRPGTDEDGLYILAASPWEYLDGEDWRKLLVVRDGETLLCVYPKDMTYCGAIRVSVSRDAVLHSLTANPSGGELFPDALYADAAQEQDGFYPFGRRFIPGVCAYFTCADAFTKPGARVELSFTVGYHDFEIEGYSETQIYLKKVMRVSDLEPPKEYEITAAETKWEYYNGVGWSALEVNVSTALFCGETSGRLKVIFKCPNDLCRAVVGAHDLPFIRVRLIAADNLYRRHGRYKAPFLSDIRFSYNYQEGIPITDISVYEHLDAFERTLPARFAAPPDGPAALYFAFDTAFTSGTILFHLNSDDTSSGSRWEYLTGIGWSPLSARDYTEGLSKTGILSYETSQPAVSSRLWGREAYWMRLVFGDIESANKHLYGLYENAVHAVAGTPGSSSVLPAGSFTTIITPIAGVESALNPITTYGSADAETEREVISRLSAALSHTGRAVSRDDCEELALEASLRVLCVKHYPHTDANGSYAYGQSCLVILTRDECELGFGDLREEILAYITPRRALGAGQLSIIPPHYIAVNVFAHIQIESRGEALSVKNRIEKVLEDLLSPMNWRIGNLPAPGQISAAIRALEGVSRLMKLEVSYTPASGISISYARAIREAFILPVNGTHELAFIIN